MTKFYHGQLTCIKDLDVSAPEYWAVLTNWVGVMDWLPEDFKKRPAPVTACVLAAGQSATDVPLTRVVTLQIPGEAPQLLRETLIHKDDESHYLRYIIEGIGPGGMRNYLAQQWLDPLDSTRVRVTLSGRFDVSEEMALRSSEDFLRNVYEVLIPGMGDVAKRRRKT